MATVVPFKGVVPSKNIVNLIPSKTVARYSKQEFYDELENNPYSFLQVIFPEHPQKADNPNSVEYLKKIKSNYKEFIKKGTLVKDDAKSFYIYQQIHGDYSFTGIIGCCSVDDYLNGVIKIHEQTFKDRVEKLSNYLKICDINADPVLITYPDNDKLNSLTLEITNSSPAFDFVSKGDGIQHTLWKIKEAKTIELIQKTFNEIPALYIADGHHRSASSASFSKYKREKSKNYSGKEAYNFILTLLLPESQLLIHDYNRLVRTLNALSPNEFITKLSEYFVVEKIAEDLYKPDKKGIIGMYLEGNWYSLKINEKIIQLDEEKLDASYLHKHVFHSILNLHGNKQLKFVEGPKGMAELKKQVDTGKYKVAFALFPVSIKEIEQIADAGKMMPPKTTWIEPKLRSGLVIYELSE